MNPSFSCYPWQMARWHDFQQAVQVERLAHALCIYGAKGTGKMHFAKMMAQALLCERHGCQQCRSCHLFSKGHHPDCFFIEPEEPGKAIKIDTIREALAWLALSPQQGRAKVLILAPLDALTVAASNALLKNLEEPMANTTLILLAEQIALVLPTLKSRCQLWHMPAPAPVESRAWLSEQGVQSVSDQQVQSAGPLALLAREHEGTLQQEQTFYHALDAFLARKIGVIQLSKDIQKLPTLDALNWLQTYWQQLVRQALVQGVPAEVYCQQGLVIQQLKALKERGANLNWPLQWDALLCRLKP